METDWVKGRCEKREGRGYDMGGGEEKKEGIEKERKGRKKWKTGIGGEGRMGRRKRASIMVWGIINAITMDICVHELNIYPHMISTSSCSIHAKMLCLAL